MIRHLFKFIFICLLSSDLFAQNMNEQIQKERTRLGKLPIARNELGALQKIKSNGFQEMHYGYGTRKNENPDEKPHFFFWAEKDAKEKNVVSLMFPHGSFLTNQGPVMSRAVVRYAISPEVIESLKYFSCLHTVNFDGTNLNDNDLIKHIAVIQSLRSVNVANTAITQYGLDQAAIINPKIKFEFQTINSYPYFWQRRYIDHLQSVGVHVVHSFVSWPHEPLAIVDQKFRGIEDSLWVNIRRNGLSYSPHYLQQNKHPNGLIQVNVTNESSATSADFAFLENNTKLIVFNGNHLIFTNEIMDVLRHNTGLRILILNGGGFIDGDGIDKIVKYFPDLHTLYIDSSSIPQEKILELLKLKELTALILPGTDFSYSTLQAIAKDGRKFETLVFRSVENDKNNAVVDYSVLNSLSANGVGITNIPEKGIENLFKIKNLKLIFLSSENLTGARIIYKMHQLGNNNANLMMVDYPTRKPEMESFEVLLRGSQ